MDVAYGRVLRQGWDKFVGVCLVWGRNFACVSVLSVTYFVHSRSWKKEEGYGRLMANVKFTLYHKWIHYRYKKGRCLQATCWSDLGCSEKWERVSYGVPCKQYAIPNCKKHRGNSGGLSRDHKWCYSMEPLIYLSCSGFGVRVNAFFFGGAVCS